MSGFDFGARGLGNQTLNGLNPQRALSLSPRTVKRIAIFGDSFVGGAGVTAPLTFAIPFAAALRAKYGDAGAGYIPWYDGKMGGLGHSTNFFPVAPTGPGTVFYRWDADARKKLMFGGLGYYRDAGTGAGDAESTYYTPNTADSFSRGVADTVAHARAYFTIRSANSGFQLRQSDLNTTLSPTFSSGASFTGSSSGTTLTASAVTGMIPRSGARVLGGVTTTTVITGGSGNSGGAGTYVINSAQTVASTSMTTDPNIDTSVGVPQCVDYFYTSGKNQIFQMLNVYGDVVVSGVEHFTGNAGVTISDFGVGGTLAYQFASLDPVAQRRYFELANFDLVIFVLGMNDRTYRSEHYYGADMARLVSWAQRGNGTKVLLVRQTDPSDASSTFIKNYGTVLQSIAQSFGCGYYDMRTASPSLADYTTANTAGLMYDGVHMNNLGNTIVGNDLASKLAF